MSESVWIDVEVVHSIHDEQLAEHGGQAGVRDRGLLESALSRPHNQYAYGETALSQSCSSDQLAEWIAANSTALA